MITPYRAREYLNGFSAKAAYMYVQPLELAYSELRFGLKPLDKISIPAESTDSAEDELGYNSLTAALYVFRLVSQIVQTVDAVELLEHFTKTNLGLKPV
jgi:hypothetical protein